MRKILVFISVIAMMGLLTLTGCREKGLQSIRGEVRNLVMNEDTLTDIVVFINEHHDTMTFNLNQARLQNGIMLPRDSVIVDYVYGRDDSLKALVVTVIPKVVPFEEPAPTDTLVTRPVEKEKK